MSATILIVEDEFAVARGIQYALQQEGYEVAVARSGEEGLEIATRQAPDLVVLDVRLPGMDGFEVLRRLRAAGAKMPVLVLTARDDEVDKVIGLELGADDYLTKPFGLRELMSRIKALLRRSYGDLSDAVGGRVIRHGDLLIDLERRRVQRGDRRVSLSRLLGERVAARYQLDVSWGQLSGLDDAVGAFLAARGSREAERPGGPVRRRGQGPAGAGLLRPGPPGQSPGAPRGPLPGADD